MNGSDTHRSPAAARCSSCGVHRNRGDRCEYCGALYPDAIVAGPQGNKRRSLDKKYKVKETAGSVQIMWIWRNASVWFLIPFFIFWNSVAFSLASVSEILSDPLSAFPIPGIHLLVGVVGAGYVIVSLINKTTILAKDGSLSLRHHPIPWPGNARFRKDEIESLFVSKARRSSKNRSWDVPVLQLVTRGGTRYELLKGRTEVEFADYETLRLHILEALGLDPRQMYGAVQE